MRGYTSTPSAWFRWVAGAVDRSSAATPPALTRVETANALFRTGVGAVAVGAVVLLDMSNPPLLAAGTLIAGGWLFLGSAVHLAVLWLTGVTPHALTARRIPLRFTGPTGRFVLRRTGRSHVEVRAGHAVVAELKADGGQDELVVYDVASLSAEELSDFGSAIGQAMDMVVAGSRSRGWHHSVFE
jgi:hypothetical protein